MTAVVRASASSPSGQLPHFVRRRPGERRVRHAIDPNVGRQGIEIVRQRAEITSTTVVVPEDETPIGHHDGHLERVVLHVCAPSMKPSSTVRAYGAGSNVNESQ